MTDPIYGLLVNLFLMGIALWSISESLIIRIENLGITRRSLTQKGIRVILCAFGVVFFSFWKDCRHEKDIKSEKAEQSLKDSINKQDIVKAVTQNSNDIITGITEYYRKAGKQSDDLLKYVRDSIKKGNTIVPIVEPDPSLTLCLYNDEAEQKGIQFVKVSENLDSLYMHFCLYNNDLKNFSSYLFCVAVLRKDTVKLGIIFDKGVDLLKGNSYTSDTEIKGTLHMADHLILKVIGTFFNAKTNKKYLLDLTYTYYPNKNRYIITPYNEKVLITEFAKKNDPVVNKFYQKHTLD